MSAGPLMLVSAGLQLFQGFQAYQQGKAQASAAQATADYNAQIEKQRSDVERMQLEKQQKLFAGTQKTRMAGSGATLQSFSQVEEDTINQSLLDVALLNYDTKVRQGQILYGGQMEAYSAKQQGKQGLISGLAGAAQSGYQSYQYYKAPSAPSSTYKIGSGGYNPAYQAPPIKPTRYY